MTTRHARLTTQLGELTAVVDEAHDGRGPVLVGLYFPGHWTLPEGADHGPEVHPADEPLVQELGTQLDEYLAGERREFTIAYELRGGEHHRRVWALLEAIPYGTRSSVASIRRICPSVTLKASAMYHVHGCTGPAVTVRPSGASNVLEAPPE